MRSQSSSSVPLPRQQRRQAHKRAKAARGEGSRDHEAQSKRDRHGHKPWGVDQLFGDERCQYDWTELTDLSEREAEQSRPLRPSRAFTATMVLENVKAHASGPTVSVSSPSKGGSPAKPRSNKNPAESAPKTAM
jgi:hypothetical protein